jgi:hypothetical protein
VKGSGISASAILMSTTAAVALFMCGVGLFSEIPASAATSTPSPAAPLAASSQSSSPGPLTLVRLIVRNCNGCTVGVQRGLKNEPTTTVVPAQPNYWNGPTAKVRNGLAILSLPTAYTPGASFILSAPWEGDTGGVTNIALGGRGAVGRTFTANQAQDRKRATACWAGTTASSSTINVSVTRRTMPGTGNKPAVFAIAWASPSVAVTGSLSPTVHGMLGNQDMYFC